MSKSNVLRVATFNIRYDSSRGLTASSLERTMDASGEMPWNNRKRKVVDTILFHRVDIVGMQEVLKNQLMDLEALLGQEWRWLGVGRDDGKEAGEFVPIFYNKLNSNVTLQTPDVPGSKGWDADLPQSAKLILRNSQDLLMSPDIVFLTGDFNCEEYDEPYKLLTGKKYANNNDKSQSDNTNLASMPFGDTRYEISNKSIETSYGFSNTFTGFSSSIKPVRIDFIMVNNNSLEAQNVKVLNHGTMPNLYDDNMYISDHRPVVADLRRSRIYSLVREGYPSRYVAKKEGVSQSSVVRITQKAAKTGSVKDLPKSGRPRVFTE
ncbi:6186_t:CDS:2 [Dentiscutata heterogama]|uniref:6186_t:CDS:1 n=1 Tax=Dentiscutata heterogama TaxID=1316150 RepID=A0ACA9K5I2_9GLOM|nr:6186_t:CDS:2 [Dentiscutata heterogama]